VRTLKLTLEYDGTAYVGWQRQAEGVSIQSLLEDALAAFEGSPVTVHGAGRTDAGVHALAQVASVRMRTTHPAATIQRALNAVLPLDVRVVAVADVPSSFHARFDAISKTYEYRIVNAPYVSAFEHRYVWHVPGALDVEAMRAGAAALVGTHDFAAFRALGGAAATTVRTILSIDLLRSTSEAAQSNPGATCEVPQSHPGATCEVPQSNPGATSELPQSNPRATPELPQSTIAEFAPGRTPGLLRLRVVGDGFLRHMVRTIAGTLVDVGLGRWGPEQVARILEGRDRAAAGRAAPSSGLFLVAVGYRHDAL
jgi:tRNA pseudouridine38-40 synthase